MFFAHLDPDDIPWELIANGAPRLGPDVATTLNNLAGLYHIQGKYADAEPLYRRALDIRERALGPDHPDVATILENLAVLLRDTRREAEAEELERKAKDIHQRHRRNNPD